MSQNEPYFNQIIFRLDAGQKVGLGHLSRCMSLAEELIHHFYIHFIIKTNSKDLLLNYINKRELNIKNKDLTFLEDNINQQDDLDFLQENSNSQSILVLDHYAVNVEYQLFLKSNDIHWFQFDSHAKTNFYGDYILHASPGATEELYSPLIKNKKTISLLGTKYAIVSKIFRNWRKKVKVREGVNNIFICFGGGSDKGMIIKCLNSINLKELENIQFFIFTNEKNPFLHEIKKKEREYKNINLLINSTRIAEYMAICDLAIIPPGTLSYEAACLGLPMLLITTASNQHINASGWANKGCGINIGNSDSFSGKNLNIKLLYLVKHFKKLKNMSIKCFETVDGKGTKRVKDKLLSIHEKSTNIRN